MAIQKVSHWVVKINKEKSGQPVKKLRDWDDDFKHNDVK